MAFFGGFPQYSGGFNFPQFGGGFNPSPVTMPAWGVPNQIPIQPPTPAYAPGQDVGAKLTYVAGRGRAEGIRYALALARVPWTEEHLTTNEQFEALKATGKLPFDQLPLLEFRGGHLVQSAATVRAIGRHANLYGASPAEAYRVDSLIEAANDLIEPFMKLAFSGRGADAMEAALTTFKKKVAIFERLFEHHEDTNRPWVYLVKPTPTVADSQLAMALRWAIDELGEPGAAVLQEAPRVARFLESFEALPQIQAYLTGPQRQGLPDDAFVGLVKSVFAF